MTSSEYIALSFFIGALTLIGTALCLDYGLCRTMLVYLGVVCFAWSIGGSCVTQKKLNRVNKILIAVSGGILAVLIIFALMKELPENWRIALACILFCGFAGLIVLRVDVLFPSAWLRRKLFLMYGKKQFDITGGKEERNGKKIKFVHASDILQRMTYAYYPDERCLHVSRRIFIDPMKCEEEYDRLLDQIITRIAELQLPVQIGDPGCENKYYAEMEVLVEKRHASKETLCSLKTIFSELKSNYAHVYMMIEQLFEVWFIESVGSRLVWADIEVIDPEFFTEEEIEERENIENSIYFINMTLRSLYFGPPMLVEMKQIDFLTKEKMMRLSSKYAEYVNKTK